MSTLKTHNLQSPDAGSVNIALAPNAGMVVAGVSTFSNIVQSTQFKLLDNAKAIYGNSADMEIYHNATNSLIQNGTGSLQIITTTGDLFLRGQDSIKFNTAGNNERLRISSNGLVNIGAGSGVSGLSPLLHLHKNASNSTAYLHITNNTTGITNNDGFLLGINGVGDCLVFNKDSTPIRFATQGIERLRIDSNGRIIMGSSSNTAFATAQAYRLFQIGQTDGGWINLARTGVPADGNHLGAIQGFAKGADGTYHDTVAIDFKADGTPSNTSKPSKIEFYTTKSGTTSKAIAATLRASGRSEVYVQQQQLDIYSTGSGEQHSLRLLNSDATAGNEIGIYFGPANNVAGAYISGYAYGDFASTANRDAGLRFGVRQNGTFKECVRINDGGFFQATNIENSYEGHTFAADLGHQFNSNQRYKTNLWLRSTNTNFENGILRCSAVRAASTSYHFITCTSGNLTDDEFRVRGDGSSYTDGNFNGGGADYAEYFEWTDGNSSNEDRRGMTVVLDGSKVKLSTSSDSADDIIGAVSGKPTVTGDSASERWTGKYQKDDYNAYKLDSDGHRQLNPSFDDTKTYIPREDRQEWDAIGMMGKLRIRKGQKTGTRWIKMRDVSDTIEEWLVR